MEPLQQILDEYKVNYLTEYSGRRGIHVWIIFSHLIKKDKAFQILSFFRNKLLAQVGELCYANLGLFPATNISKGNIVGKQVKMPLSCHRAGGRSWLCEHDFIKPDLMDEVGFLAQQLDILSRYNVNDYQRVCESIGVNDEELIVRLKYRKYEINNDIYVYGPYEQLLVQMDGKEELLECICAEVAAYNDTIAKMYNDSETYYAPVIYLSVEGEPVIFDGIFPLITNPLELNYYLGNWEKAGITIENYEVRECNIKCVSYR